MKPLPPGGQRLLLLLLTLLSANPGHAQSPNDVKFLSTLGELREATYSDKASIVERLSQGGHPSVRAVLTALMEKRPYSRNNAHRGLIAQSPTRRPLDLTDAR